MQQCQITLFLIRQSQIAIRLLDILGTFRYGLGLGPIHLQQGPSASEGVAATGACTGVEEGVGVEGVWPVEEGVEGV